MKSPSEIIKELLKHIDSDNNSWNLMSAIEHANKYLESTPVEQPLPVKEQGEKQPI